MKKSLRRRWKQWRKWYNQFYGYNNSRKDAAGEVNSEEVENKVESDLEEIFEPDVKVRVPQDMVIDAP